MEKALMNKIGEFEEKKAFLDQRLNFYIETSSRA